MSISRRIRKLEEKSQNLGGWYTFYLLTGESIENGRKRVGIPIEARNVIAVRGGLPVITSDPLFIYRESA